MKIGLPFNDDDLKEIIDFGKVEWDKYEGLDMNKESDEEIFRLHLTFSGADMELAKKHLSQNPEETILELLKKEGK